MELELGGHLMANPASVTAQAEVMRQELLIGEATTGVFQLLASKTKTWSRTMKLNEGILQRGTQGEWGRVALQQIMKPVNLFESLADELT